MIILKGIKLQILKPLKNNKIFIIIISSIIGLFVVIGVIALILFLHHPPHSPPPPQDPEKTEDTFIPFTNNSEINEKFLNMVLLKARQNI